MIRRIVFLVVIYTGLIFGQDITWQGIDFPTDATNTIRSLEAKYGKGVWVEDGKHYQGEAMFLGQEAHVELMVNDNFIHKAIFTWQEESDNILESKSYWRRFLRELLGTRVTVDLFSGEHVWQQEGAQVRWSQSISQETRTKKAPTITGSLSSKGKNRRLYSIDREEYETTNDTELNDVQMGEDEEFQVNIISYRIELSQQKIETKEPDDDSVDLVENDVK